MAVRYSLLFQQGLDLKQKKTLLLSPKKREKRKKKVSAMQEKLRLSSNQSSIPMMKIPSLFSR